MAVDPVCGMQVDEKTGIRVSKGGKDLFFCSSNCRDRFTGKPFYKNKLFLLSGICLLLLGFSFVFAILEPFRESFLSYLRSIWWAVLLGLLLGGVIDHFVPSEYVSKILARKGARTIFNSVFLGFLMSACSHGILALSIQLHKKGASNPAVVSFLLASPWANFAVTMMILSLFGIKGLFIIIAALVIALNTGFIFILLEKNNLIEKNKNITEVPENFSIIRDFRRRSGDYKFNLYTLINDIKGIRAGAVSLADMVLWWIILGMLLASLAGAYIPVHFFHKFMGPTMLGLLVTLGIATVIEVCSEGSSPLAFEIYARAERWETVLHFLWQE